MVNAPYVSHIHVFFKVCMISMLKCENVNLCILNKILLLQPKFINIQKKHFVDYGPVWFELILSL